MKCHRTKLIFMIEIYECFSSDTLNDFFFYVFFSVWLYQLNVVLFEFSLLFTSFYTSGFFFLSFVISFYFSYLFFYYFMLVYILSVRSICMAHNNNNLESHFQYHEMIYVMLVVGHCLTSVSNTILFNVQYAKEQSI